ncbi:MAG: nuclear transport factor 2 family protein [Acidobacteria bacterium]|nr:nuclear transport factor 2 family protein [Acidobacteriota bacterium]
MNHDAFRSWLDAYGRAWETRDPQAAADLFTQDATYQETPFDEPLRGRAAIRDYWSHVPRSQEQIRFDYDILAVTGNVGIAQWRASFVRLPSKTGVQLNGIFVVCLDAENRCKVFREWWHRRENSPHYRQRSVAHNHEVPATSRGRPRSWWSDGLCETIAKRFKIAVHDPLASIPARSSSVARGFQNEEIMMRCVLPQQGETCP